MLTCGHTQPQPRPAFVFFFYFWSCSFFLLEGDCGGALPRTLRPSFLPPPGRAMHWAYSTLKMLRARFCSLQIAARCTPTCSRR